MRRHFLAQEPVRDLQEDAGAVTGVRFAAAAATVVEVHQDVEGLTDEAVGGGPLQVGDEADAAGAVVEGGIVQPLLLQ